MSNDFMSSVRDRLVGLVGLVGLFTPLLKIKRHEFEIRGFEIHVGCKQPNQSNQSDHSQPNYPERQRSNTISGANRKASPTGAFFRHTLGQPPEALHTPHNPGKQDHDPSPSP